jgi:hypothetical protein
MSSTIPNAAHATVNAHFVARRVARLLGYAGLIPFAILALLAWLVPSDLISSIITAQLFYAVAILAFLGGLHWGATLLCPELTLKRTRTALWWGITPSLIGVGTALLPNNSSLVGMMCGFAIVYIADRRLYAWYQMPDWLFALRLKLTMVVLLALAITFLATYFRS